ncbi:23S rRNA (pseudouridine(1915)-N(3))-methyltransferase RlmH [Anaerotalea alkaliphila]|uniref:Ribosomal RNA large subunit methyltransferase H n=1 Tax=Anaerotalea alkaliphila TaxID=2662126 RepID=A0A7X5KM38_9FIRM|nr:23S rRNA (pseudouridine(1915)-N(3))-methyltransferase RlmH [Anaerotalea alkaliphila]NDL66554.1 23S rRNA (pseudouridine(1915)-N(3))-methyltransferase RlmH [Anaerotalea alkaliphila]
MKVTVISVGKVKESHYANLLESYGRILERRIPFQAIEVADEKAPENLSEAQKGQVKEREGERILQQVRKEMTLVVLAIEGREWDTPKLERQMRTWADQGKPHVAFVIGGSLGVSEKVLARGDLLLSFSKMTFPHQLMKVLLMEQLARVSPTCGRHGC